MAAPPNRLWTFAGGLRLPGHKQLSDTTPARRARLPRRLVLPLQQHICDPAEPCVEVGDKVLKGERIACASGYVSTPLHAPSSGIVVDIGELPVPHASGLKAPCIVIETDGEDKWTELHPVADYTRLDAGALRNLIREAGIVGMGGAGFPTFIKLNPGPTNTIQTLILNGAECEPYITCDDALMREHADQIIAGLHIMRHALGARECIIGIEGNKPEALHAMTQALGNAEGIRITEVPTIYPAGGEKQLIKMLTGREVPSHGLPAQIGVVCHNVGTAVAVYRAIRFGEPLVSRYLTVTGHGVERPGNLEVLIGTPFKDLLDECGYLLSEHDRLIMGGPMMGVAVQSDAVPVIKTTNCVLAATAIDIPPPEREMPCIRCGKCAAACPVRLLPQQMYWYARARDFDKVQDYNLFDCIECGCCAYVCPSAIPLVQYYRFAKAEIWAQEREKQKADLARQRHEFRLVRLDRDKRERTSRHKETQKAPQQAGAAAEDPKKAIIQAALERVRRRRQGSATPAGDDKTDRQQDH